MLICEMEINGLPKTVNAIGNAGWRKKMGETRKWKAFVYDMCVYHKIVGLKLEKAKLTYTRCSSVESDFDNLAHSFKAVQDGLVVAEVIVNDKMSNIGQPTYLWEHAKPGKGKIRIKLETVDTE